MARPRVPAALSILALAAGCGGERAGVDAGPDAETADARSPDTGPPPLGPYPSVEELPERPELPSLFESFEGASSAPPTGSSSSRSRCPTGLARPEVRAR